MKWAQEGCFGVGGCGLRICCSTLYGTLIQISTPELNLAQRMLLLLY